jgi:signal transduction histidine kinase
MTLAARLAFGSLLLVVLMAGLAAHLLLTLRDVHQGQIELVARHIEAINLRVALRRDLESLREFTRKLFALSDADYREALAERRRRIHAALEELVKIERSADVRAAIGHLADDWGSYLEAAEPAERQALESAGPHDPGPVLAILDRIRLALDEVDRTAQSRAESQLAETASEVARARRIAGASTAVALTAALLVSVLISRSVLGPIRQLARGAGEIADGNFQYHVPERGGPELVALAREFNSMARRLAELDDLKSEFVSNVSHDLKAPLASMQETSRLLLDGTVGPPSAAQERLLRLQLDCGARLSAMIGDLLELASLEAGVAEYEVERVDLADLAATVAKEASGLVDARRLELELEAPEEGLRVDVDRQHLARALWNLVANAARFTPEGGRLGVTVERREACDPGISRRTPQSLCAALSVWDSGPGVSDADKERIFDRFQQGRGAGSGPHGTGLGLAIARRIATDHGGELWVEDRPSGGAVFVLTLPLPPAEERA